MYSISTLRPCSAYVAMSLEALHVEHTLINSLMCCGMKHFDKHVLTEILSGFISYLTNHDNVNKDVFKEGSRQRTRHNYIGRRFCGKIFQTLFTPHANANCNAIQSMITCFVPGKHKEGC